MSVDTMVEALALVEGLDFDRLEAKLMDDKEGEGWSQDHCRRVCVEYRRFLALRREYPDFAKLVPSSPVDTFWHYHILDTARYAADCERIFGSFLHHDPNYGMGAPEEGTRLLRAFHATRLAYRRHFGPPPKDLWRLPVLCG